jgi:urease accessory protein
MALHTDTADVFDRNRAVGTVAFDVRADQGVTRRGDVHEAGSLRVRFPNAERDILEAVLVNTAGGTAGGDRFSVSLHARENAKLQLTTAAAEKIYRSHGPAARIVVELRADANAHLAWLPQETILFDEASVSRSIDIELADSATLALCEIVVFGRTAMGERMRRGQFRDRWRLRRGGKLVFAETVTLDGDIAATLDRAAVAKGAAAVGTLLLVPGDEERVTRIRDAAPGFAGEVGFSAWNGFALARFCAQDAAALRADVVKALALAQMPLPRLWLN